MALHTTYNLKEGKKHVGVIIGCVMGLTTGDCSDTVGFLVSPQETKLPVITIGTPGIFKSVVKKFPKIREKQIPKI